MSRENRLKVVQQIQEMRESRVLTYFTGDRRGPISSNIAEDAVRYLYEHLLTMSNADKASTSIDLILYSRGGDVSVPWRIVSMIREFCGDFRVLIPYKAHSAATMVALGADSIVMGKKAELSPIDPTLTRATAPGSGIPPQEISVEDVTAYISFMRDRANINDQDALAQLISQLAEHLTPLAIGSVNRQYSHIRIVARKLLGSRAEKMEEEKVNAITETLTEKIYSHGHAIGRVEAVELGLPVAEENLKLEELLWKLYLDYEKELMLDDPLDPLKVLIDSGQDLVLMKDVPLAMIESTERCHVFYIDIDFRNRRDIPANPQINININAALPPSVDPATLGPGAQQIIQQMLGQMMPLVSKQVQEELARQSPVVGCEVRSFGGRWVSVV